MKKLNSHPYSEGDVMCDNCQKLIIIEDGFYHCVDSQQDLCNECYSNNGRIICNIVKAPGNHEEALRVLRKEVELRTSSEYLSATKVYIDKD